MAEFIVGNAFRKIARRHQWLRELLWRIDYALVWSLIKLFSLLPIDTASRLGYQVGRVIGPLLKKKTAVYEDNFRIAFPDKTEAEISQLARASWGTAGRVLAEYPNLERVFHSRNGERIQYEIQEPNANFRLQSRPSVLVAAHLSNWEMTALAMAKLDLQTANLYSPPTNPLIDRMLCASREALMCELLPRDNSARSLVGALKKGKSIGMIMDRRIEEGQLVPLFGRDKPTSTMAAKLALKFDVDLIPVRVERLKDSNFKITFCTPVVPGNPEACESEQAVDMIRQVHHLFEQWISEQPQDWFCPKRLWPKQKTNPSKNTEA